MTILITVIVIAVIGIVVSTGLVVTEKKFHVEVDPREADVRAKLPGNNCGACGYAGCDALSAAIVAGKAPVNACPVGGGSVAEEIGRIMGVAAGQMDRKVAFVRCKGSCDVTHNQGQYIGEQDCRAAALAGIPVTDCDYGCLGFGSCATVCPEKAIYVNNGVAAVNRSRCVGCGLCVKACPRGLIELVPESKQVFVQCRNQDKGPTVKKVCSAGCIGCSLCSRVCENEAVEFSGALAHIIPEKCVECGKCVEKCPVNVITRPAS